MVRQGPRQKEWQEFILRALAKLMWKNTAERTRKGGTSGVGSTRLSRARARQILVRFG
jgi:hypothetical protein